MPLLNCLQKGITKMSFISDFVKYQKDSTFTLTEFSDIKDFVLKHTQGKRLSAKQLQNLCGKVVAEIERRIYE